MSVPETWVEARLTDVCELNPKLSAWHRPNDEVQVTFVPMSAVDESIGMIDKAEVRKFSEVAKGYSSFVEGDVLFAKVTPCMENGKAAVVGQLEGGVGFGSTEFHVLRPTPEVHPEYIFCFVRQQAFRDRAAAAFAGTGGLQRVPLEFLRRVRLPLPTLPEQQRIVEVLRQAGTSAQARASRRKCLDDVIKAALDELVLGSDEAQWERLGSLVETRYGTSVSADATLETGVPVLRIPNVMGGQVDLDDMKYVELTKAELDRLSLTTNDVLIVRSNGNPNYVGRAAPITEDVCKSLIVYASYLIRLRTNTSRLLPEYLSAFLNSAYGRAAMRNAIRTTAGQSNLSGENLVKVRLPVPSFAHQARFRSLWLQVKKIRGLIDRSEAEASELLSALGIEALSGGLTARWREKNSAEISEAASVRDEALRMHGSKSTLSAKAVAATSVQADLTVHPARRWLLSELSEFQRQVLAAFVAHCQVVGAPLLVEDPDVFARFCDDAAVTERLEAFGTSHGNRIRRSLSQLAALGLIAKVTLPKVDPESGELEYLKAFRPLRPDEFTRLGDVQVLRKALSPEVGGEPS